MGPKCSLLFLLCLTTACCQTVGAAAGKKQPPAVQMLAASVQRTLPGIPGAAIKTSYYFAIVWLGAAPPETFYWKGDAGWWSCGVAKAHKVAGKGNDSEDFNSESIRTESIRKGDTLFISATRAMKQNPPGLPATRANTLCYTAGNARWGQLQVKKIVRKQDIAMP